MFSKYYEAISFLEGLSNIPSEQQRPEVYIKRMQYFLKLLGNPEKGLKYIHIAGTSGKGSVTNMVHEILFQAGKKVGSFTSPFVTTSIEKIKVEDRFITPGDFVSILDEIKPYIDKAYINGPYGMPSYFEIFMAIAFIYFKKRKCEWVVLEVGLGGRFDATNVIKYPVVTAITNIDYDHMEILGKTLSKIGYDKAGIIKPGSIFFTTEQNPSVLRIFKKICKDLGVPFNKLDKQDSYREYNKLLATSITKSLGIEKDFIKKGIEKAKLQCRFEIIQENPTIVLDGAHNPSKMRSTVLNLHKLSFNKLHLIIGISHGKDSEAILKEIVPLAHHIYVTRFQTKNMRCTHPSELYKQAKKYVKKNTKIKISLDPHVVIERVLKTSKENDLILVTGSFFLAGEMRKRWYPEETILTNGYID